MIVQSCTSIRQLSVEKPLLYLNKFLLLFCKRYPRPSLCRNVSSVRHERSDPCTAVYTIPHPPLSLPHHLYIYVILSRKALGYPHGISSEEPLIGSVIYLLPVEIGTCHDLDEQAGTPFGTEGWSRDHLVIENHVKGLYL